MTDQFNQAIAQLTAERDNLISANETLRVEADDALNDLHGLVAKSNAELLEALKECRSIAGNINRKEPHKIQCPSDIIGVVNTAIANAEKGGEL